MRERPILFSAPMVRAILAGTKTVTRRIVKSEHAEDAAIWAFDEVRGMWESGIASGAPGSFGHGEYVRCPYGEPGDRLWVRETWQQFDRYGDDRIPSGRFGAENPLRGCEGERSITWSVCYRADGELAHPERGAANWRPSIFMPRWASRITLDVVSVRVERLHDITEKDARAEGVTAPNDLGHNWPDGQARRGFADLWATINGAESWAANPFVWRVEFKRAA